MQNRMSALPPIADIPSLFDHLVGNGKDARRNGHTKRLSRLEIDHELKFGWLKHREAGRFRAPEYPSGVDTDLAIGFEI